MLRSGTRLPAAVLIAFIGRCKHERLMLTKGFALAKTRRSAHKDRGDITVTFDDGTSVQERNLTEQPKMILGWGACLPRTC